MSGQEFKPCPFCGNIDIQFDADAQELFCGAHCLSPFGVRSYAEAVQAWNLRTPATEEKIAALETERDALAALVAEKDAALRGALGCFDGEPNCLGARDSQIIPNIRISLTKSHPSVERARLVAKVVKAAQETIDIPYISSEQHQSVLKESLSRLAAHDAKENK